MKKLSLIRSELTNWFLSDKQMMLAVSLIYSSVYVIKPLRETAAFFNEPLNCFECFLTLLGNGFSMMVIVLVYMTLIIDYPDLTGNALFVISRLGRKRWLRNQLIFVYITAAIYLFSIFLFCLLLSQDVSFWANGWSNVVRQLLAIENEDLRNQNIMAVLDASIQNNYRPYEAMFWNTILMYLQVVLFGQLQICLTVRINKIVALIVNILIIVSGAMFWHAHHWLQWLFPIANATVGWHNTGFLNQSIYPLWASTIYLLIGNVALLMCSDHFAKKCDFMLGRD